MDLRDMVLRYLESHAGDALAFWTADRFDREPDVLAACDTLYILALAGHFDRVAPDAGGRFAWLLSRYRLAGGIGSGDDTGTRLNVHLTAYSLGTLNLLLSAGRDGHDEALRAHDWQISELIDPHTLTPQWPAIFNHHSWRLGHWIGGIPSIVKSLWALCPHYAERNGLPSTEAVLRSSDRLIDAKTGLLRVYRMQALQNLFRYLYRFRHDPDAGAIGGIAHLHWVNYASNRLPYKGASALYDLAWSVLKRRPFVERVPYCLDFDVVQIARTSIPACTERRKKFRSRTRAYADDLTEFYSRSLANGHDSGLHKLPGGLATLHECALANDMKLVPGLNIPSIDIAKRAYWI